MMKKDAETVKDVGCFILLFPVSVIVMLCLVVVTPFDYLKYKRTQYYKNTGTKYTFLAGMSPRVKLYEVIKKEQLPIDFYRDETGLTEDGYFLYRDTLILNDYVDLCYDEERNRWQVEIEDEYVDIQTEVNDDINRCNELLKANVCRKAVALMDGDTWEEHPDLPYENIAFVPVYDNKLAEALKTILK